MSKKQKEVKLFTDVKEMELTRLGKMTLHYWEVSKSTRAPVKDTDIKMPYDLAFKKLFEAMNTRPEEWRLSDHVHVLRFDLVEGNTKWREREQGTSSIYTLPMKN